MKAIILIYYCVAILPSIIHGAGNSQHCKGSTSGQNIRSGSSNANDLSTALEQIKSQVDGIIGNKGKINDKFTPTKYLGTGSHSQVYAGKLISEVAMKISPTQLATNEIVREYNVYRYLNAIGIGKTSSSEEYGIPTVYLFEDWGEYTLLATTLLDPEFTAKINNPNSKMGYIDILIICREFVFTSKYMHSHGICHGDINFKNMMFRKNRGFLIDFENSYEVCTSEAGTDCRKTDWKNFLDSLRLLCPSYVKRKFYGMDVEIIEQCTSKKIKEILKDFEDHIPEDDYYPIYYDEMYEIITDKIAQIGLLKPVLPTWMTLEQKSDIYRQFSVSAEADIKVIDDPYAIQDYN